MIMLEKICKFKYKCDKVNTLIVNKIKTIENEELKRFFRTMLMNKETRYLDRQTEKQLFNFQNIAKDYYEQKEEEQKEEE